MNSIALLALTVAALLTFAPAQARTIFLDMRSTEKPDMAVMGDVDNLVETGHLAPELGARLTETGNVLINVLKNFLVEAHKKGLHFGLRSADALLTEIDSIDLMFDLIPKLQGFSPIGAKATEISSAQFYNHPGRRMIIWPAWSTKQTPIASDILKELNRALVTEGILAHEVFSILGVPDQDYSASTDLLRLAMFSGKGKTFEAFETAQSSEPLKLAGGGGASVVGGGGNDLAFALKLILQALAHQLESGRLPTASDLWTHDAGEALLAKFAKLDSEKKQQVIRAINSVLIEEAAAKALQSLLKGSQLELVSLAKSQLFGVRIIDVASIERALSQNPKALDALSLKVADSILNALASDREEKP